MAKKKQRAFKMFDLGGPLVIPQSAMPSYMAPATNLSQAPTPNIAQPMQAAQGAQAPAIGLSNIAGGVQGVAGLYQTIAGNLSVPKIQEKDFTAGSKQELLSKATDFKGYEMPKTNAVSSGLGGAASGAAAGTAIAPGIGTAIGGAVGLVGGVASSIFGNSKRKRAKRRAERDAMNNINAQNTELTDDSIYNSLSSQLAGGGDLYDDTSSKNRGKITAQTDNTYVEKPRIEEPIERTVHGVKWSELDFKTQLANMGNRVDGYPTERGLEIVSPEFDIISGARGLLNVAKATNIPMKLQSTYYNKAPWTFKPNPDSYYRAIPKEAIDDAIETGVIRHKPVRKSVEVTKGINFSRGSGSRTGQTYFLKGHPWTQKYSKRYGKPDGGTYGDYFIEASDNVPFIPIKTKGRLVPEVMKNLEKNYNPEIKGLAIPKANVLPEKVIPLDENVKLYKPDWLRGFKEIKTRKYKSGESFTSADILLNSSKQNTKALGGSLAHSGEFSNGVTLFENGGTHEENQLGGIPQGYNENGELNLVEQGETKWKDYIFSDRNKLSKAERFGLPGMLNNRTFSSAAKTIQKESKERPLDLISKRGLDKQMDYLMSAQEEHNAMSENTNQFKSGGQMNFKSNKRVLGSQGVSIKGNPKTVKHAYGDWLRYAPVASNVIGLASDITSTPETVQTARIEAPLLSEKMSYDPIDQEYLTNKLTSNYSNLVDKIQGSSGGNRGVSNASMIAAMNNLYDAYGDTAIKSKGYNRDMLSKTLEFNRATSQANAQMLMDADKYNANAEDRMTETNAANRAARRNAIREQIAGLGENLGAIGTEQRWMDLAPKLFRGYKSNGDYINQTIKNIVLDNSDAPSILEVAKSRGLIKEPSRKISQKFIDLAADLQSKSWAEKRKKAKEEKNG